MLRCTALQVALILILAIYPTFSVTFNLRGSLKTFENHSHGLGLKFEGSIEFLVSARFHVFHLLCRVIIHILLTLSKTKH